MNCLIYRPLEVTLPAYTLNNGSLYLHAVLTSLKNFREVNRNVILSKSTSTATTSLTRYAQKQAKAFKLLNTDNQSSDPPTKHKSSDRPITHWKPKLILSILSEPLSLSRRALPGEIAHLIK